MEAKPAGKVSVRAIILLVIVALVVLALDQLAKWWVVNNLPFREPQNILGNLLIFEYDRNPGAAFSIGTGSTWIFSIVATAVLIFVIWYARRIRSWVWALVFGLVLGGLLGNLTDRLFRPPGFGVGEVVDFIRIPLLPAIFNLADSAIVAAMILFLLLTVLGVGLDGKRAAKTADAADGATNGVTASETGAPASSSPEGSDAVSGAADADDTGSAPDSEPGTSGDGRDRAESRASLLGEAGHPVDGRA
ncbi:signal peptidase II [Rathayibacter sp. CAU 1779]